MKRKELFSAVRDEHGDLAIYFPESDMASAPKKIFWKQTLTMIEGSLKGENTDLFSKKDRLPAEKAAEIIKKCLGDW